MSAYICKNCGTEFHPYQHCSRMRALTGETGTECPKCGTKAEHPLRDLAKHASFDFHLPIRQDKPGDGLFEIEQVSVEPYPDVHTSITEDIEAHHLLMEKATRKIFEEKP